MSTKAICIKVASNSMTQYRRKIFLRPPASGFGWLAYTPTRLGTAAAMPKAVRTASGSR